MRESIITVVPLTAKLNKRPLPTHVLIHKWNSGLSKTSLALAEQIETVEKDRLGDWIGVLSKRDMERLTKDIQTQIGA